MQQHLRVPVDPLVEFHVRVSCVIKRHIVRDDKARLRAARNNQVPQVAVICLGQYPELINELPFEQRQTLTLHCPVPTDSPFSNNLPATLISWFPNNRHTRQTEREGDVPSANFGFSSSQLASRISMNHSYLAEAASGAPGSEGTYSPGIPRPPVGRTTWMSASSTALGCSVLPSPVVAAHEISGGFNNIRVQSP